MPTSAKLIGSPSVISSHTYPGGPMPPLIDRTGEKYGRLTVIARSENIGKRRIVAWLCRCECGRPVIVTSSALETGNTRSCGCLVSDMLAQNNRKRRTHGMKNTRVYVIWHSMHERCRVKSQTSYKRYGGRGITVCDRWSKFENFLADMGLPPSNKHQLDRIDPNGHYEPGNCRWATPRQQQNNRRNNVVLSWSGEQRTVTEWARYIGIGVSTLFERIRAGWPVEKVLTEPVSQHHRNMSMRKNNDNHAN